MTRRKKRSRRTRLSTEEIRQKSAAPSSGRGNWFTLPDGVGTWEPEKAGRYMIDILPYETTSETHPNGVAAGVVWYQYPFRVHHNVGPEEKSIVCPTSVSQRCPICEEVKRLSDEDYEENKKLIKSLRGQRIVAYNILDPEDPEKVCVFAMSVGKFFNLLQQELDEAEDEELANFFDVNELGRSLRVRFSEDSFAGNKYLTATKIDFVDRDEMDEEDVFSRVVNLDEMFVVTDYEKLKALFLQEGEDEEEEEEEPKDKKPRKRSKPDPEAEKDGDDGDEPPDSDDDEWDDEDWDDGDDDDQGEGDEEPKAERKPKRKPTKRATEEELEEEQEDGETDDDEWDDDDSETDDGGHSEDDEWDDEDWDDGDDEWDDDDEGEEPPPPKKSSRPLSPSKAKTKSEGLLGDCTACDGTGGSSKGGTCRPCKGTGSLPKTKAAGKTTARKKSAPPKKARKKTLRRGSSE